MAVPFVVLKNGCKCPAIGLGTWRSPPEVTKQAIKDAIDVGYRHLDCAHIYGNETYVGEALQDKIKEGVIKRDDMFITSKLWNTFHRPEDVHGACTVSLKSLQISYLDLYLIHWPMGYKENSELYPKDEDGNILFSDIDYVDTWRAMEQLVDKGLCRSIGLSNFNEKQIKRVMMQATKPISVLQVECHPYLNQQKLMDFCKQNCIAFTAYSPLGSPHSPYKKPGEFPILQHPMILKIAEKYQRSAAEILIAFQVQRGNIVIPRSINKEHMSTNLNVHQFQLSKDDMTDLNSLDCDGRFMIMDGPTGHRYHPFESNEFPKDTNETIKNETLQTQL